MRAWSVGQFTRAVELASRVGAPVVVVHPGRRHPSAASTSRATPRVGAQRPRRDRGSSAARPRSRPARGTSCPASSTRRRSASTLCDGSIASWASATDVANGHMVEDVRSGSRDGPDPRSRARVRHHPQSLASRSGGRWRRPARGGGRHIAPTAVRGSSRARRPCTSAPAPRIRRRPRTVFADSAAPRARAPGRTATSRFVHGRRAVIVLADQIASGGWSCRRTGRGGGVMRAVCLVRPGVIGMEEVHAPRAPPTRWSYGCVLWACAGSDLSVVRGFRGVPSYPWVLRHEGGGALVQIGSACTTVESVSASSSSRNVPCFSCPSCSQGPPPFAAASDPRDEQPGDPRGARRDTGSDGMAGPDSVGPGAARRPRALRRRDRGRTPLRRRTRRPSALVVGAGSLRLQPAERSSRSASRCPWWTSTRRG